MKSKLLQISFLFALPFLVSGAEWLVKLFFINSLGMDFILLKYALTNLAIIIFLLFSQKKYGMKIPENYRKLTFILLIFIPITTIFLFFSLQSKGLLDPIWNVSWMTWILIVFREEFLLRGIIQTKAAEILPGKIFGLSKAIWFTSVIFALWHLINLPFFGWQPVIIQIVSVMLIAGPLLGWIREKTGSTLISYLVHQTGDFFFYALYLLIFSKLLFAPFH